MTSPAASDSATSDPHGYRGLSLWLDQVEDSLHPRPALPGDTAADIAIVGAGFTGLWTGYYLARADPSLRIVILESEVAGFGASGRNGGWCSELFPASSAKIARDKGRSAALLMRSAMRESISAVSAAIAAEGIDCSFTRGGTVAMARSATQLQRAHHQVADARKWGDTKDDLRFLEADETAGFVGASGLLGGTYTPHCAVLDPARLVRGLADRVVALGVQLFEHSPVRSIGPHCVSTDLGTVRAEVVIRATEAYTSGISGSRREVAPVYSLVVATEPLTSTQLDAIGLDIRPSFTDFRHLISYGQRTADGRIVFGGRGAPYHFGSRTKAEFDSDPRVFNLLQRNLIELFPGLEGVKFTHSWGGPLGVPRDWHASVGFDPLTGFGWAGGYVGDGVSTTNLAGRTLADLVRGVDSDLTALPWVGHRSRRWEPEPLRWAGVNAGLKVMQLADASEARSGRESRTAKAFGRLLGG